jgi:hypothetical protein
MQQTATQWPVNDAPFLSGIMQCAFADTGTRPDHRLPARNDAVPTALVSTGWCAGVPSIPLMVQPPDVAND